MQYSVAVCAFLTAVLANAGTVPELMPNSSSPAGCMSSYPGKFQITVVDIETASNVSKRSTCTDSTYLMMTLNNSELYDAKNRTGYIASNYQFQFDGPPQSMALYTGGWSACSNGSLALGDSAVFYKCLSGDFYNLYTENWAAQCSPIYLQISSCFGGARLRARQAVTALNADSNVIQISDGQVQYWSSTSANPPATSSAAANIDSNVIQISDGQIQYVTASIAMTTASPMTNSAAAVTTTTAPPTTSFAEVPAATSANSASAAAGASTSNARVRNYRPASLALAIGIAVLAAWY